MARRPEDGCHVVRDGEWISKIAESYGLDWKTIWDDAQNREIRDKRKEPDVLYPGDRLFIPQTELREEQGETESRHRFRVKLRRKAIKFQLLDEEGEPRKDVPCTLEIDGQECPEVKKSDSEGIIKAEIPNSAETGYLYVGEDRGEIYDVMLGCLEPIDETEGVQQRLANLDMYSGAIDGVEGPVMEEAVIAYQEWENKKAGKEVLKVDGIVGPKTRNKLEERSGY